MEMARARPNGVALYELAERRRRRRRGFGSTCLFFCLVCCHILLCLRQVWAVGEDRGLYFRMGVTPSEPSGNGWIPVSAQWGTSKGPNPPRWV